MEVCKSEVNELFEKVVDNGFCIGCGACALVNNSPIEIKFDEFSKLQATIKDDDNLNTESAVLSVCPFSDESSNEDELGENLFRNVENIKHDEKIGYYKQSYAGYALDEGFRENGSSGGMGTWIISELFKNNIVDGVIHVHEVDSNKTNEDNSKLFKYKISRTINEIQKGSKSRYYPIELSEVLTLVKDTPGKYAVVGLPCFIKSIRLLMKQDEILKNRIKICVGLVCGHLKSANFAKMWGWQVGIHPDNLKSVNFRHKLNGEGANNYAISATQNVNGIDKEYISKPLKEMYGSNWGWGLFKYKACDFCDDVVAETADVTIGDAWLPQYINDDKGTNIVIVRNELIYKIIENGIKNNNLKLDFLSSGDVIKSQSSGFNHRREGLSYRLALVDKTKQWRPIKRSFTKLKSISNKSKKIQKLRIKIYEKSHVSFEKAIRKNSFLFFKDELDLLITRYNELYKPSFIEKLIKFVKIPFRPIIKIIKKNRI
ncbi:Coenzyme F420-reducing hydrogenase, beta subunit [Polaribacter sp. KT25b]|uniref:Coenzyme F420 hydrogenase/dehydrogenase, beta subunit C-terminal domain n=1 Tax=Polaribacter sp. KT25b TaxID=1855336 RepID=UPI00087BAC0A|nr:Coenzyme F420 hydrogenase/dehydrogenase, beta subunit C-terminal domain [Polaribacter sp. KT25b]SDS26757.1 Coenzyme F420-reducing hydrogenase, beta subunit [Polaribacter sp. KT25b]